MSRINPSIIFVVIAIWMLGCYQAKPTPKSKTEPTVCVNQLNDMPTQWQPSQHLLKTLLNTPWTATEQTNANASVRSGLEEMIAYQASHPESVFELWDNSVEAYIDVAYAADHQPKLRDLALDTAIQHFEVLWHPYEEGKQSLGQCDQVSTALTLLVYGHNLSQRRPTNYQLRTHTKNLIKQTNQSLAECATLDKVMTYNYKTILAQPNAPNAEVYDLVMWSIVFIDALRIKAVKLPEGTRSFVTELWQYLSTYPTPAAVSFAKGANDPFFYDLAYLMTHVGYIPTGYGRHQLKREHGEWLYTFIRSNFYAVMEMGELDLTAEFVDLMRQYGCNEDNDRQVRDGSRHLLQLYQAAGGSWMNHRESYESIASNPYDLMHKPWTAIAGLRHRQFETNHVTSYGHVANTLLK